MDLSGAGLRGTLLAVGADADYLELAKWGGLVLLGIVLMVVVAVVYRRRYRAACDRPPRQAWALEDLNAMHARGDINDQEYGRLRDKVLSDMGIGCGPTRKEKRPPLSQNL